MLNAILLPFNSEDSADLDKTPCAFIGSRHSIQEFPMPSTVSLEVVGGPSVQVPWTADMTAQNALEAAFDQINSSATFTYALQFYGAQLGYLVLMINETYDSFISSAAPFFYWEFLVNDQPATKGIDSTTLSAGDAVKFSFEQYIPAKHKGALLEAKREFQRRIAAPKK
jgi:hypothetical protein